MTFFCSNPYVDLRDSTPPNPLEREISALSATPLFWGRAVVPEFSCRVFIMEDQIQIQSGLRGICGS
jgi:hypothetical protein